MRGFLAGIMILALLGGGVWYFLHPGSPSGGMEQNTTPYVPPPLTKAYSNETFSFSLMVPADFAAQELPADENGSQTLLFQNASGEGIQISILPFDEDLQVLTKERIQQDVPDLQITHEQPVEIGQSHTGLAFKSNNDAFGGASREVWFVFKGNLYQISTYERLDPLLKAIFTTWKFL